VSALLVGSFQSVATMPADGNDPVSSGPRDHSGRNAVNTYDLCMHIGQRACGPISDYETAKSRNTMATDGSRTQLRQFREIRCAGVASRVEKSRVWWLEHLRFHCSRSGARFINPFLLKRPLPRRSARVAQARSGEGRRLRRLRSALRRRSRGVRLRLRRYPPRQRPWFHRRAQPRR
jgi:hypothetical protein